VHGLEEYIMAFLLRFKDDGTKKTFFYYLLPDVFYSPTFTSKCFLTNYIKHMHIFASGPELQADRFGHVILGENL
jgi:hypothetical protein